MARAQNIFYVVAILASAHSIAAEEGSGQSDSGSSHNRNEGSNNEKPNPFGDMMNGFSSLSNFGGSGGNPFGGLGGSGDPFSGLGAAFGLPSFGTRHGSVSGPEFDTESNNDDDSREVKEKPKGESDSGSQSEEQLQSRLFFSSLLNTRLTTCNYTTQAGATCPSCREVLHCRPNNVGTVKRCGLFFPYCNNGRCSLSPGAACNAATTTVSATTTTAAATTTAATTIAATTNAPTTL